MAHIQPDICREIFLRLSAKYLVRLKAVCKPWRAVIDDPSFARALINKQLSSNTILIRNSIGPPFILFELEALIFTDGLQIIAANPLDYTRTGLPLISQFPVAACDGLMLVAPEKPEQNWGIWNPLTHERLELPAHRDSPISHIVAHGIGYDCATDDYKAVVIARLNRGEQYDDVYETHVYSLKSDSWRIIMDFPCPCDDWGLNGTRGVFLSGALHWLSWSMIIVLDLGTEKYRQLKLPPLQFREGWVIRTVKLDALGGCLIVSDYGKDDYTFMQFDVWVMKDYGAEDSWMELFSLKEDDIPRLGPDLRPVAYVKDKMQFFLQGLEGLYLYDVESNSVKMVVIHGISHYFSVQVFDGSVFRLRDNCGVGGSVATERRIRETKSKVKMADDAKLLFCVRDVDSFYESHDSCYNIDSTWYFSSSENEDEDEEQ